MTATFTNRPQKFTPRHRCGNGYYKSLLAVDLDNGDVKAEAKLYQPAMTVYCCLWITGQDRQGSGSAGGYGYHFASAALDIAIRNAGIDLDTHIYAAGDGAMTAAMDAIGLALGLKNFKVLEVPS